MTDSDIQLPAARIVTAGRIVTMTADEPQAPAVQDGWVAATGALDSFANSHRALDRQAGSVHAVDCSPLFVRRASGPSRPKSLLCRQFGGPDKLFHTRNSSTQHGVINRYDHLSGIYAQDHVVRDPTRLLICFDVAGAFHEAITG